MPDYLKSIREDPFPVIIGLITAIGTLIAAVFSIIVIGFQVQRRHIDELRSADKTQQERIGRLESSLELYFQMLKIQGRQEIEEAARNVAEELDKMDVPDKPDTEENP